MVDKYRGKVEIGPMHPFNTIKRKIKRTDAYFQYILNLCETRVAHTNSGSKIKYSNRSFDILINQNISM